MTAITGELRPIGHTGTCEVLFMYARAETLDIVLLPQDSVLTAKGDSAAVDIHASGSRTFLLQLSITEVVEQEYLEITVMGSKDGTTWDTRPLASLPQHFYPGDYQELLDLSAEPSTQFLKFHWEAVRWGRGEQTPHFVCSLKLREVPQELLVELRNEGKSSRD